VSLTVVDELARWQQYAYGKILPPPLAQLSGFGMLRNPISKVAMSLFSTRSSIGGDVDLSVPSLEGFVGRILSSL
jgi:hypothetical protein